MKAPSTHFHEDRTNEIVFVSFFRLGYIDSNVVYIDPHVN